MRVVTDVSLCSELCTPETSCVWSVYIFFIMCVCVAALTLCVAALTLCVAALTLCVAALTLHEFPLKYIQDLTNTL